MPKNKRGQSLVEVLVAMAVFILVVASAGSLILNSFMVYQVSHIRTQAIFLAREGVEAVRSMRDADFDNLTSGNHGLLLSSGKWIFFGESDALDKFTRTVNITDINIDTKKIESNVSWDGAGSKEESISLVDYLTDWKQTQGQAGYLNVLIPDASVGDGGKILEGVNLQNNGADSIVIDKITVWWNNSSLIEKILIDGRRVWDYAGIGSPSGRQFSGTEIDVRDFRLTPGPRDFDTEFHFNGSMIETGFIILFKMVDGSTKYILVEPGAPAPLVCPLQADILFVGTASALIGGGGNKELRGVTIENSDSNCAITIDKITMNWNNSKKIEEVVIDGIKVWSKTGPGTPRGNQPSGTELDIQDFILNVNSGTKNIDRFKFDGNMSGATFGIKFQTGDGSVKSTGNFSPPTD